MHEVHCREEACVAVLDFSGVPPTSKPTSPIDLQSNADPRDKCNRSNRMVLVPCFAVRDRL